MLVFPLRLNRGIIDDKFLQSDHNDSFVLGPCSGSKSVLRKVPIRLNRLRRR